jgi:chromosome segregation ATPase
MSTGTSSPLSSRESSPESEPSTEPVQNLQPTMSMATIDDQEAENLLDHNHGLKEAMLTLLKQSLAIARSEQAEEMKNSESKINTLQGKVFELKSGINPARYGESIEEYYRNTVRSKLNIISDLEDDKKRLQGQKSRLNCQLKKLKPAMAALENEVMKLEKIETEYSESKAKATKYFEANKKLKAEAEELKQKSNDDWKIEKKKLEKEIADLKITRNAKWEAEKKKLEGEVTDLKRKREEKAAIFAAFITKWDSEDSSPAKKTKLESA